MSSGPFVRERYAADYDNATLQVHPIFVQPETTLANINGATNDGSSAAINNPISCRVTGSRKGIGLFARTVTIRFPFTGQPSGYSPGGRVTIPALTRPFWNSALRGVEINYLGVDCTVVGRSGEVVK